MVGDQGFACSRRQTSSASTSYDMASRNMNIASENSPRSAETSSSAEAPPPRHAQHGRRKPSTLRISFNSESFHRTPSGSESTSPVKSSRRRQSILSTTKPMLERAKSYDRETSQEAILRRQQTLERKIDREEGDDTKPMDLRQEIGKVMDLVVVSPFRSLLGAFKPPEAQVAPVGSSAAEDLDPTLLAALHTSSSPHFLPAALSRSPSPPPRHDVRSCERLVQTLDG